MADPHTGEQIEQAQVTYKLLKKKDDSKFTTLTDAERRTMNDVRRIIRN